MFSQNETGDEEVERSVVKPNPLGGDPLIISAASWSMVTIGYHCRSGVTSGPRGDFIQSGSRVKAAGLKNVMGSVAYCRKAILNRPQFSSLSSPPYWLAKRTTEPLRNCGSHSGDPGLR